MDFSWVDVIHWATARKAADVDIKSLAPLEQQVIALLPAMLDSWRMSKNAIDPKVFSVNWVGHLQETLQRPPGDRFPPVFEEHSEVTPKGQKDAGSLKFAARYKYENEFFPNAEYGFIKGQLQLFSKKKDAKHYAALCGLHYLLDQAPIRISREVKASLAQFPIQRGTSTPPQSAASSTPATPPMPAPRRSASPVAVVNSSPVTPLASPRSIQTASGASKRGFQAPHGPSPTVAPRARQMSTSSVYSTHHQSQHPTASPPISHAPTCQPDPIGTSNGFASQSPAVPIAPMVSSTTGSRSSPAAVGLSAKAGQTSLRKPNNDLHILKDNDIGAAKRELASLCGRAKMPIPEVKIMDYPSNGRTRYRGVVVIPVGHKSRLPQIVIDDMYDMTALQNKLYDVLIAAVKNDIASWKLNNHDEIESRWSNV